MGLMLMVITFIYLGNKPSLTKTIKKSVIVRPESGTKVVLYDGEFIKFEHEANYTLSESENTIQLLGMAGKPSMITIALRNTDSDNIDEVSGVAMRRSRSEEYKEVNLESGLMFIKQNPIEYSAFYLHDKKSLTIAMVVNSNDEKSSRAEFEKILNSIEIK